MNDSGNRNDETRKDSAPAICGLVDLLERIGELTHRNGEVCMDDIIDVAGTRWFGPLLMIPGLIMLVPGIGDIPGVPILMGLVVILVSAQAMLHRSRVWLPHWIRKYTLSDNTVRKLLKMLQRPSRFLDRLTRPRLTWAVTHASTPIIGLACILIAFTTPVLELIPFSATLAGAAILTFGLAVLSSDGFIALVAIAFSLSTLGLVLYQFVL